MIFLVELYRFAGARAAPLGEHDVWQYGCPAQALAKADSYRDVLDERFGIVVWSSPLGGPDAHAEARRGKIVIDPSCEVA